VKYAYQELPHSEDDTAYQHNQEEEGKTEHGLLNVNIQNRHHQQLTKMSTRGVTALE
jgi:hypothetical protein